MRSAKLVLGVVAVALATGSQAGFASELKPDTVEAWDQYVQHAHGHMRERLLTGRPFLWSDESPERKARLKNGEVLIAPLVNSGTQPLPNGLIHHWIGAVFIPNATLDAVLSVTHNYEVYKDVYGPKIVGSKLLACESGRQKYSLLMLNTVMFVTAALDSQYESLDFPVDRTRWYSIAHATSVQEVAGYGQQDEHLLPQGQGNGFIWRLESMVRYDERDGGVYMELEAIGLTRDIPRTLRWAASPLITRLSRSTLATSLQQTRRETRVSGNAKRASGACGLRGLRPGSGVVGDGS